MAITPFPFTTAQGPPFLYDLTNDIRPVSLSNAGTGVKWYVTVPLTILSHDNSDCGTSINIFCKATPFQNGVLGLDSLT